jgi:hypothetical protein
MALSYRTGRTRTLRLLMEVTVSGAWTAGPFGGSSPGQTLGAGSTYTTIQIASQASDRGFNAFSAGLGVQVALGQKGSSIGGDLNIAIGVVVPSLTGNGFVPLTLVTASSTATFTVSTTRDRNLPLVELLDHANNGKRFDVFDVAGTCTEVYTVHAPGGDQAFTAGTGTLIMGVPGGAFPPGQTVGWESYGLDLDSVGAGAFVAYSEAGGAAAEVTWSGSFVDSLGDPLYGEPTVPTNTGTGGSTRWGRVATIAPTTVGIAYNYAQATLQWMPRHAFNVKTEPRALPDGRLLVQQHRVEYELVSPIGGSGATSGYDLYSSGETATFTSGGAKWVTALTGEGGFSVTYDDFLPVLSRVKVTHNDANRHYFAHIKSPFNAISLAQQQTMPIPGCAALSVSSGGTQTVSVGVWLGYRFLRVTAHAASSGTGTLTVGVRLNGSGSDTETATLTSTSGSTEVVEIDLVETPGLITTAPITLTSLHFAAASAGFVIDSVEGFVKYSSVLVSCGLRRGLYSGSIALPGPESTPWLQGYTDGVLSLQAPSFDGGTPVGWWSQSVRQLVAEINGTSLHSYGSWGVSEPLTFVQAAGSPPAPSSLTGWSASDAAPPDGGKGYSTSEVYNPADFADSDVYVSALHGDGLIYGSPLIGATL